MGCPTSYEGKTATWSKGKLSRLSQGTLLTGMSSYTYTYNGYGQRISRNYSYTAGTADTGAVQMGQITVCSRKYYYDHAGRLIAEDVIKTYYGEGTTTENIVFLYDESGIIGMVHTVGSTANTYYFQRNLQGDVVAIYDANGVLKAKYLYDAWGNCTISSETTSYDVANANPIRYRGYYYDDDTGLYYCNARYYSPKWRRSVSPGKTKAINPCIVNGLNSYVYTNNNPVLVCPQKQVDTHQETYNLPVPALRSKTPKTKNNNPLIFSVGLVTPESVSMPAWMDVYGFYVKGTLGWGYTFGEGYSLVSFGIGVLDATFHLPKLFGFLPDSHLANPNIFLGVGTWNANASVGLGISGTAEILSGTIGIQFGNSVSFGAKGYVGIGFTLDFTNGIRFGVGFGLGFELYLAIDWYELFN